MIKVRMILLSLLPNSRLYFSNIDEIFFDVDEMASSLIEDYSLTLNYKESSYILPVFGKFSITSFTDLLGLDMSDVEKEATYISPLDSNIVVGNFENMTFIAKKYHNISFRSPVNDLITVKISGAVNYPGTYTLQSDSSLSDLYQLVGDFKDEAFLDGIVLTRESVREKTIKSYRNFRSCSK